MSSPKQLRRVSLTFKFNLLVTVVILLTMLATSIFLLERQKTSYYDELLQSAAALTKQVAANSVYAIYTGSEEELKRLVKSIGINAHVAYLRVTDDMQRTLFEHSLIQGFSPPGFTLHPQQLTLNQVGYAEIYNDTTNEHLFDLVATVEDETANAFAHPTDTISQSPIGYVQIGITKRGIDKQVTSFIENMLVATTLFTLIVIGVVFIFTRRIVQPLAQLTAAAQLAAHGDFDQKIEVNTHDEVHDLAESFNELLKNLQRSREELTLYHESLEQQVQERTHELQEAKDHAIQLANQAETANHSKSMFLANMSHELRTPLTSIIGFAGTLLDDNTTMQERIESIRTIIRNGQHLQNIINDILDLSKIEANKLTIEHIDVDYIQLLAEIESSIGMQARNKDLEFNISYQFPLPCVAHTDPLRLKQILLNLCSNAIKFTETGGVHIAVNCNRIARELSFTVSDTGIGLNSEQISRMFQHFEQADKSTTRRFGGTGLGLSLSRKLANLLGGDIEVESEEGVGSKFTLRLPTGDVDKSDYIHQLPAAKTAKQAEFSATNTPFAPLVGHVLLAEDTPDNQRLISHFIRKTGAQVTIVDNGAKAVEAAMSSHFDLILMDMQMPVMDGLAAVRRLRQQGYNKPIAALTANAMREDQDRCIQAGCNEFLTKPINQRLLVDTLQMFLTQRRLTPMQIEPMTSSLLKTDPSLSELVCLFIERLPQFQQDIRSALQANDMTNVKSLLHNLKGLGGGYGYYAITDLAKQGEFILAKQDHEALVKLVADFDSLCERIYAGRPSQI